ncbi:MAG: hypothetical protein JWO25_2077 [Alphaproteobacteria bacterium]|nr:hypothetical protein [Alphaproteobacteria bacterium]
MKCFLSLLMIVTLVIGHGSSVAAAICQHRTAGEHAMARASHDGRIAARALSEEAAANVNGKKAAPADTGASAGPTDMLPPIKLVAPLRTIDPILRRLTDAPSLAGTSHRPLLEPPTA